MYEISHVEISTIYNVFIKRGIQKQMQLWESIFY